MTTPPRLVIRDPDGSERTVELRDGVMRIGRSADNEIVLGDASKGVSRSHAELHIENGRFTIVDLHSQNGTWLNALRVQRAEVRPDAEIAIGLYRMRLQIAPQAPHIQAVRPEPSSAARPTQPATVVAVPPSAPPASALPIQPAPPIAPPSAVAPPVAPAPPRPAAVAPPLPPPLPPPAPAAPPITDLPMRAEAAAATSPVPMPPIAPASKPAATAGAAKSGSKLPLVIGAVAAVAVIALGATFLLIMRRSPAPPETQTASAPAPAPASTAAPPSAPPAAAAPAASAPAPAPAAPSQPGRPSATTPSPRPESRQMTPSGSRQAAATPATTPPAAPAAPKPEAAAPPTPAPPRPATSASPAPPARGAPSGSGAARGAATRGADPVRAAANELPVPRKPGESLQDWQQRSQALQARYAFAKVALDRGDYSAAAGGFAAILLEEPGFLDTPQLLVKAREGLRAAAADAIESGNKLDAAGDWVNALKKYDQAREIDRAVPGLDDAYKRVREKMRSAGTAALRRAKQFDAVGRFAEALSEYEKAVQWLPGDDPQHDAAKARADQLKARLK
jgi:hypothetical protein